MLNRAFVLIVCIAVAIVLCAPRPGGCPRCGAATWKEEGEGRNWTRTCARCGQMQWLHWPKKGGYRWVTDGEGAED